MASREKSFLVVGGPGTGKTHFGGQLYGRLRSGEGHFRIREQPEDISLFEEVLKQLNRGKTAEHTPADFYGEAKLPLVSEHGGEVDLIWPDYSGEKIEDMLQERQADAAWRKRIVETDAWLFFIRLDALGDHEDIISRPLGDLVSVRRTASGSFPSEEEKESEEVKTEVVETKGTDPESSAPWSDQAKLIELLQLLLFTKGTGTVRPAETPALGIVLSCWDELSAATRSEEPGEVLSKRLPLLHQFTEANWENQSKFVVGLSSLERSLDDEDPDEEYVNQGPEHFGFVVQPNGDQSPDLTLPLKRLMHQ